MALDNGAKIAELDERAVKAEKENSMLKDQALCYQENVDRLKGKEWKLMSFTEHVQQLLGEKKEHSETQVQVANIDEVRH